MAAVLKREHQLMSLRVELVFGGLTAEVKLSFENGGSALETWSLPLEALGLRTTSTPELVADASLPLRITERLATLANLGARDGEREPLWLHLIRPYGYLGIVPWEQILGAALKRPILRLPDFLERSQEDPDCLQIAVCYDPPWKGAVESAHGSVQQVIAGALASPRAQIDVHLFTTDEAAVALTRGRVSPRLHVHDARAAKSFADTARSSGFAGSSWLDWMETALRGVSLDAVHFICGTEAVDERATLLLRSSPAPYERPTLTAVHASELSGFLQRTGAWAALFSAPPGSGCVTSCRFFADSLAQIRPGPVLFHEFPTSRGAPAPLEAAYAFLFAPEPSVPPQLGRDFLYCQPSLVRSYEAWDAERPAELGPARPSPFRRMLAKVTQSTTMLPDYQLPEQPGWTSAAQRYVEKAAFDSARFRSSLESFDLVSEDRDAALSANNVVQSTLSDIQSVIQQYANRAQEDE